MTSISKYIFILVAGVMLSAGCKKNTTPGFQRVNVDLQSIYCPVDSVYAGTVYWETAGTFQSAELKRENNSFVADITQFTKGAGTISVQLYSVKKVRDDRNFFTEYIQLFYENRSAIDLSDENVTVNGPTSLRDEKWRPRWIINAQVNNFENCTTIIGIWPDDPYFEIKNLDETWNKPAMIERRYYDSNGHVLIEKTWAVDTVENTINRAFFSSLNEELQSNEWSQAATIVRFETGPSSATEWSMFYSPPL